MNHLIRRQYLHVDVNGTEADGIKLQRDLPELCRQRLLPAIEQVLQSVALQDEQHLTIERLEIDTGILPFERLEHDLCTAVALALEQALHDLPVPERHPSSQATTGNICYRTERQRCGEALDYFLTTGRLPWFFRLPDGKNLEQAVLDSWRKTGTANSGSLNAVIRTLSSSRARKRLLYQFSPAFSAELLLRLSPESQKNLQAVLQALHAADAPPVDVKNFVRQLWETAFASVAAGETSTAPSLAARAWASFATSAPQHSELLSVIQRHWPAAVENGFSKPQNGITYSQRMETQQNGRPSHNGTDRYAADVVEKQLSTAADSDELEDGVYIDCAGLVLLHPFLPRFFEALGIAAEDRLLQSDRALCFLHFLATGQTVAPEYALVLPKILCNVPLEASVESLIELSSAELEEATALLDAVVHHWEALRNTSIDGLRGTFLIRPGKVSLKNDGDWLLQVEAQSFDILLDQLPWGIGMIKLPWMEKMLWVEWR